MILNHIYNKVNLMRKKALPLCLLALLPSSAVAQSDDFGLDFSLEAQKKINKQWSIGLEGELRTRDNTKTVDRWSVGLGVDYKVLKWLKASAGYNLLYDNNQNISRRPEEVCQILDSPPSLQCLTDLR